MKLLLNMYADNITKCKFCRTDVLCRKPLQRLLLYS